MSQVENWARTQRFTPRREVSVGGSTGAVGAAGVARLAGRVAKAEAAIAKAHAEARHVRAVGSRWSFSSALVGADVLVQTETSDAGLVDVSDAPGPLSSALAAGATGTYVLLEAGAQLHAIFTALEARGLGVFTAGSSSGQTIAGVMSTGTHGADFRMPPLADYVRAIVLVDAAGRRRWLEPKGPALTADDAAAHTLLPGAIVTRRDDLFDAALVSVGALGVVCAVVLEVRALVGLSEKTEQMQWSAVRAALSETAGAASAFGSVPPGQAHPAGGEYGFLEAILNPYRLSDDYSASGDDERGVRVVTRAESPTFSPEPWTRNTVSLLDGIGTLWTILNGSQADYRAEIDGLIAGGRGDSDGYRKAPAVFDYGVRRTSRVWSAEAIVTTRADAHLAFLDDVLARFDALFATGKRYAGFLSIRFTQGTRASLGPQTGETGPSGRFCHVECFALQQPRHVGGFDPARLAADTRHFIDAFWAAARERRAGGEVCLSWGQQGASPEDFFASPKRFVRLGEWHAARRELVGEHRFTFANDFGVRAWLSPLAPGWRLLGGGVVPRDDVAHAPLDCRAIARAAPTLCRRGGTPVVLAAQGDGFVGVIEEGGRRWALARPDDERVAREESLAGALSAAETDDGRPMLVGRSHDGRVYSRILEAASLGHPPRWGDWQPLHGGRSSADPTIARSGSGHLLVAALGDGGAVQVARQAEVMGWIGWDALAAMPSGAKASGRPRVVRRGDGHLMIATADDDGGLWLITQSGPRAKDAWGAWQRVVSAGCGLDPELAVGKGGALLVASRSGGGLSATWIDDAAGPGIAGATPGGETLREGSRVAVAAVGAGFVVGFTDGTGRVCLQRHAGAGGWGGALEPIEAWAVSAPSIADAGGGAAHVYCKVAHDMVQVREVSLT